MQLLCVNCNTHLYWEKEVIIFEENTHIRHKLTHPETLHAVESSTLEPKHIQSPNWDLTQALRTRLIVRHSGGIDSLFIPPASSLQLSADAKMKADGDGEGRVVPDGAALRTQDR